MSTYKRIYKSSTDKKIMGVCGGLGEYFNIDPTIVRVLVAVSVVSGLPAILYFILGFVLPYDYEVKASGMGRQSFVNPSKSTKVSYPEYTTDTRKNEEDAWGDF
ncbi:PspC domain-containing protein [Vaginisenegalia massiliensis]|uniref:PspC domain-containing protein n=1 Tax=Vaginisenegalia massiliensis TaxID=2058294 RepID=UPI000F537DD3|nr:PspC domain-containing protein [Vaginisenegalia massiliensis]